MKESLVLCIDNSQYPASLEALKTYRALPSLPEDPAAGMIRVVDESGEDYLYPSKCFVKNPFTVQVRKKVLSRIHRLDRYKLVA
jgi:hypothetical protein